MGRLRGSVARHFSLRKSRATEERLISGGRGGLDRLLKSCSSKSQPLARDTKL